jgi:hypothetical protein
MIFKIMKRIVNNFWGWIASHVCQNVNIWDCINILEGYNKFQTIPIFDEDTKEYTIPNDGMWAVKDNSGTVYDIYYKNLYFHIVNSDRSDVYQVFIKQDSDYWVLGKKGKMLDVSNPLTPCVEIYYWFDIETMHERRCSDEAYKKGNWNEYVAKTVNEFEDMVEGFTVESQISNAYKNFKTE